MNPVYIIDNSNFCYKFKDVHKYAHVDINGVRVSTSVLVGYIRALKSNIFDNILIVLDGVPKKSLELLPSYKGQRMHDDLHEVSVPKLEVIQFLSNCGKLFGKNVQVVCSPGQEADQVISSIVHLLKNQLPSRYKFISAVNKVAFEDDRMLKYLIADGLEVSEFEGDYDQIVIGSTDADMAQLQRFENVLIDASTSGKKVQNSVSADSVSQVRPDIIPLYKSIYGDASDNVPSLQIEAKRNDVLKYIDREFETFEQVEAFVNSLVYGHLPNERWSYLYNLVRPFKKEFLRNYDITCLKFWSIPFVVKLDNYDINSTIERYKLRI